jgi:NAD(P)-dependent dehydrogenase (short-subunit alcohol dehydrogenase family)
VECDVTQEESVRLAFDAVLKTHGRLDCLVNNAGIGAVGTVLDTSGAEMDRLYSVNVRGVFHCLKYGVDAMLKGRAALIAASPSPSPTSDGTGVEAAAGAGAGIGGVRAVATPGISRASSVEGGAIPYATVGTHEVVGGAGRGGSIINMGSIASHIGLRERFAYSATKGAMLTMTLSVATDFVRHGIRCNCVCPARVHTPFVDKYLSKHYPGHEGEMLTQLASYHPVGRMALPQEVAAMVLFLASDESAFITGARFDIDGGVTAVM